MGHGGASWTAISFFTTFAVGASVKIDGVVGLRAEASIGACTSPPVLAINQMEMDRLGLPIALLRIGPELSW